MDNDTNNEERSVFDRIPKAVGVIILVALAAVIGTAICNVGVIPIAIGAFVLWCILKKRNK